MTPGSSHTSYKARATTAGVLLREAGTGKSRNIDVRYQSRTCLINHSWKTGKTNSTLKDQLTIEIKNVQCALLFHIT